MEKSLSNSQLSFGKKTVYLMITVASALVLPQIVHALGVSIGVGPALGQVLMPMYIPVLILGFCAGPVAGAVSGIVSPILSFWITGMPSAALLPFITIELLACGLFSGLFKRLKINSLLQVLSVQLLSKILRLAAVFAAVYIFRSASVGVVATLKAMLISFPGMLIQLFVVPFIAKKAEGR